MELNSKIEIRAMEALKLSVFNSLSLANIKENVSVMLSQIGKEGVFGEYTKHDISHVNNMLNLVDRVIPVNTFDNLTSAECLMIVLSIYFHDVGMLVTSDEYESRFENEDFLSFTESFKTSNYDIFNSIKGDKDNYIFQEYIRSNHAVRVKEWISKGNKVKSLNNVSEDLIPEMLGSIPQAFTRDLSLVCESHNLDDLKDVGKYKPDAQYSQEDESKVNLQYCAVVLRTCDLLNITNDRAPTIEMRLISPKNAISKTEWLKHNPISVIRPKSKTNKDGKVDKSIQPDTFEVQALFESDEGFFSLMSYLDYTRLQLKQSHDVCKKTNNQFDINYEFPWVDIDDSSIETVGFNREQLLFTLDQTKILDLLIGHTLYNDSSVVVREIIQNSLDACSLKEYLLKKEIIKKDYTPKIVVESENDFKSISITDNGVGMTLDVIKNFLLNVGSSRYQDKDFIKTHKGFNSISRFGIGLLTCFMVADDLDIITKTECSDLGVLIKIRKVHGKYLLKELNLSDLPEEIKFSGTKVIIYPRSSAIEKCSDIKENLKRWILIPKHKVYYKQGESEELIGHESTKEYLISHLNELGMNGEKYKVKTEVIDGIETSYALVHNKLFKKWEFLPIQRRELHNISGTCIEGIRVANETPGFNSQTILAISNCSGENAPKTNVARDRIETTENKYNMLEKIYMSYRIHIENEINNICNHNFSTSWASREAILLLEGLLGHRNARYNKQLVENDDLFNKSFYDLKLVLTENNQERKLASITELVNSQEFWTIDSSTYKSADSLISYTENLGGTLSALSIINSIYTDEEVAETSHINQLVCLSTNNPNYAVKELFNKFEVSAIKVISSQRRVDLKWTKQKNSLWKKWSSQEPTKTEKLYFQKNSDDQIEVYDDGTKFDVISSRDIIFILKGCKLHDLLGEIDFEELTTLEMNDSERIYSIFTDLISRCLQEEEVTIDVVDEMLEKSLNRNDALQRHIGVIEKQINFSELKSALVDTKFVNLDLSQRRRSNFVY